MVISIEKGLFKINGQRQIVYSGLSKQPMQHLREDISKKDLQKIILLARVFYKLIRYSKTSLDEVQII